MIKLHKNFYILVCILLSAFISKACAVGSMHKFSEGDTLFVAYPAANIKDDAFIIGQVKHVMPNGDYKISVMDYVEGHDYGVSCVPMVKHELAPNSDTKDSVWELWTDTTKLDKKQLDYLVSHKDALELGYGKTYFIERNNLYIVFGRWKSDAPLLNAERILKAEKQAKLNGLEEMIPAFEIARLDRMSFYGEYGRPMQPYESIAPLIIALNRIKDLFDKDDDLKQAWYSKKRDWKAISQSTKYYFLIQAIDKVVEDAKSQLYEDGLEQAAPKDLEQLKKQISEFKKR
ncbi:hypothetical protein [Thiomicrorhabdus sp. Milos-T2]|uniref:hypothetical protein n=1 Tax=Thiomicrorhabdus sp. Milos-T2 TaxID=90814 RepID=UPI000690604B|nr:hypothetical protein [Thiomicrorhabdus sp. Milos-T2]